MFVHFHDFVIDTTKLQCAEADRRCVNFKFTNGNIETYYCEDGQKALDDFYRVVDAKQRSKWAMKKSR